MYTGQTELYAFGARRTVNEWASYLSIDHRSLVRRLNLLPWVDPAFVLAMPDGQHFDPSLPGGAPKSWSWSSLPWERDPWAQGWVDAHAHGATLEEVGRALGLTRERVRQVEEVAFRKLRRRAQRLGIAPLVEAVRALEEMREKREVTP